MKKINVKNQEINQLAQSMADYNFIISNQIETIIDLETQLSQMQLSQTQIVKISFYHPHSRGINSDKNPNRTATMTKPVVGRTVAISDELFNAGWLGSKIYVNGLGIFKAEDRMSSSISGKQIDVCVASRRRAINLGIKKNVIAVKL
jgi:3D (Asp-Asp-Asp) domain-containing protein